MEGLGSPSCDSGFYMMPDLCLNDQRKREFMNFQNDSPKSGKTQNYDSSWLLVNRWESTCTLPAQLTIPPLGIV